jgi:hypothetical protein
MPPLEACVSSDWSDLARNHIERLRFILSEDHTNCPCRGGSRAAALCTFAQSGQPRRPYLAKNFAASSATVSERNTQMTPLEVRTTRPQPLVSISLSLPDILILIRYMADLSFHEVVRRTGRNSIIATAGYNFHSKLVCTFSLPRTKYVVCALIPGATEKHLPRPGGEIAKVAARAGRSRPGVWTSAARGANLWSGRPALKGPQNVASGDARRLLEGPCEPNPERVA